jgi:hypothetical protein
MHPEGIQGSNPAGVASQLFFKKIVFSKILTNTISNKYKFVF